MYIMVMSDTCHYNRDIATINLYKIIAMKTILFIRSFFFLGLIFLPGMITNAQSFSIGAKGGLLSSKFASGLENSSRNAFYFGVVTNKKIKNIYSLQAEINYSSKGSNTKGLQPVPDFIYNQFNLPANTVIYGAYNTETILNNIEIPLLAKIELPINMFLKYYMLVGPSISFFTGAKNVTSGTSNLYQDASGLIPVTSEGSNVGAVSYDNSWSGTNEFKKINVGAEAGFGLSYGHPFSSFTIFVDARFAMNISKIQNRGIFTTDKNQDSRSIAAGFLYKL
jgi:hypothetical protein